MNSLLKKFAILVVLTTGCSSHQTQTIQPTEVLSAPKLQVVQAKETSIPVPSNQWLPIIKTSDGGIVSIETGSLTKVSDTVSFWSQVNYPAGSNITVSRSYAVASCNNGDYRLYWIATAGAQGQILQNNKVDIASHALPGSIPGTTLQYACNPALQVQAAQAQINQVQLETLARNNQTSAEAINEAMRIGAGMFK
ncbi:hypothetical protein G7B40_001620 [Aetokthonos hydrillicola Thurmond2011]|jgi:hypothetical protein|uniref:Lipoprotein n=1 Tax=Aetokthonos hydrillicola Thurmond2011 TaxID=2712845 RepID=A0AAP5M5L6_9CYAN|nr:hypothetical protein [Aetokthonos hydrillicola]MBO3462979.1 hypothetical protein [Aetokthonos hydrillicola CCALA 1050]MBW4591275.1 hypothetical protein [Aetokthonos hydrillicola CCALA 1050]MDR9893285.1 hypothetical protein [Aetokthonos hydrillicola Thurmond2011]